MPNTPIKTTRSRTAYKNQWIRVREDEIIRPDGKPGIYGVVESHDSVLVVALNDQQQILLINSFSYPAQKWHWELPGGSGEGENLLLASKRELFEETGIEAQEWIQLGITRVCDGLMTEKMATLLATHLKISEKPAADDTALIRDMRFVDLDVAYKMVQNGDIDEGQTLTSLYLLEHHLKQST